MGLGIAVAQETNGQTSLTKSTARILGNNRQCAALNKACQTADNNATNTTALKNNNCDGSGRGYGDGSKPQPKDGTGFGAKAQKRQHRNAKIGKGQRNGTQNNSSKSSRSQLRNGSCFGQKTNNKSNGENK